MKFTLDYSIETSEDRSSYIKNQLTNPNLSLKQSDLELCANYILYGKDKELLTSCVDRKEVFIKSKFTSYSKKAPLSLDELLESPTFNESQLSNNVHYKKIKPSIDKDKAQFIPGMKELWEQISNVQNKIEEKEALDITSLSAAERRMHQRNIYFLKHFLIDLRKQQYYLVDSVKQTLPPPQNKSQFFTNIVDTQLNYPVFPRGTMKKENDLIFQQPRLDKVTHSESTDRKLKDCRDSGKPYFNFLDKEHIYQLILNYWDIKGAVEKIPDSPLNNLLWTLDFYIEKANLSEQQLLIVEDKKLRLLNKEIVQHLQEELGIYHQENYVSTIWNKITQLIADAAELNYDEWLSKDYDKAWKVCNCCGKEILRDSRNFVKKAKSTDGFTGRCKECDKKKREEAKRKA